MLGAIFLTLGGLSLLGALTSSVTFSLAASHAPSAADDELGRAMLGLTGVALTIVLLAVSIPAVTCGWGLLRLRPWSRTLGIVLAAIGLIAFPFGTLFGIYALWVLLSRQTEPVFEPS